MPLVIDFSSIWDGFGRQVGRENRGKSDQKSIQKGIQKMMEKSGRLGGFWGGWGQGRDGHGRNPGPPKAPKSKKITKRQSQRQKAKGKENTLTRQARKRRGGYRIFFPNNTLCGGQFSQRKYFLIVILFWGGYVAILCFLIRFLWRPFYTTQISFK